MHHNGRLHRLRKLAPSSAAAVGIDGLTIQSMLHEGRKKSSSYRDFKQADLSIIEAEWKHIDYCLIDEISMVGCYMLAQIHKMTTVAKHTAPTVPFGGVNMIFLGDFIQYAPVLDRPLYSNLLSPNDTLSDAINDTPMRRRAMSERDIQCRVGRALWLQVNQVVFLTQQMRNKDPTFMDMQARLRNGECNDVCVRIIRIRFMFLVHRGTMKC
jgi:PIF1-like helicase